mmetsp:Transcript_89909/g.110084  ORF Transcript_89909/g.110084 Transcript_89909/m.110084 type:complete len:219 (+) Transcript_89909:71-727(+)
MWISAQINWKFTGWANFRKIVRATSCASACKTDKFPNICRDKMFEGMPCKKKNAWCIKKPNSGYMTRVTQCTTDDIAECHRIEGHILQSDTLEVINEADAFPIYFNSTRQRRILCHPGVLHHLCSSHTSRHRLGQPDPNHGSTIYIKSGADTETRTVGRSYQIITDLSYSELLGHGHMPLPNTYCSINIQGSRPSQLQQEPLWWLFPFGKTMPQRLNG